MAKKHEIKPNADGSFTLTVTSEQVLSIEDLTARRRQLDSSIANHESQIKIWQMEVDELEAERDKLDDMIKQAKGKTK